MLLADLLEDKERILDVFDGAVTRKEGEMRRSGLSRTLSYKDFDRALTTAGLEAVLNYTLHRRKPKK